MKLHRTSLRAPEACVGAPPGGSVLLCLHPKHLPTRLLSPLLGCKFPEQEPSFSTQDHPKIPNAWQHFLSNGQN